MFSISSILGFTDQKSGWGWLGWSNQNGCFHEQMEWIEQTGAAYQCIMPRLGNGLVVWEIGLHLSRPYGTKRQTRSGNGCTSIESWLHIGCFAAMYRLDSAHLFNCQPLVSRVLSLREGSLVYHSSCWVVGASRLYGFRCLSNEQTP